MMAGEPNQRTEADCQQGHPVDIAVNLSAALAEFRFSGCFPLEQTLARNQAPDQGSAYSIERQEHLVCQKRQSQKNRKVGCKQVAQSVTSDSRPVRHDGTR